MYYHFKELFGFPHRTFKNKSVSTWFLLELTFCQNNILMFQLVFLEIPKVSYKDVVAFSLKILEKDFSFIIAVYEEEFYKKLLYMYFCRTVS